MTSESIESLMKAHLFEVFGERDSRRREAAAARTYAEDVQFADPEGVTIGREALTAKVQALLDGAPDFVFSEDGPVYVNHDVAVLSWTFGPQGQPRVMGMDVCVVRDDVIAKVYTMLTR
jgi:hypothetical protein